MVRNIANIIHGSIYDMLFHPFSDLFIVAYCYFVLMQSHIESKTVSVGSKPHNNFKIVIFSFSLSDR